MATIVKVYPLLNSEYRYPKRPMIVISHEFFFQGIDGLAYPVQVQLHVGHLPKHRAER